MKRAFSFVDDVVDVMAKSLEVENITLNVGSKKAISIKELSDMLVEITGLNTDIEIKPARPQEISMFLADHSLQDAIFNYKETPLRDGLIKTFEWVKKNKLPEVIFVNKEITI